MATTSCPNHKNITPAIPKLIHRVGAGWPAGAKAQCNRRDQRKPERARLCTHRAALGSRPLIVSSTSRSQSQSLGSRDRGETAFTPGPCSGKRVKGSLGLWGTSLSSPICNAQLVFPHRYSEWSAPKVVISQRKCTSYSCRAAAIIGDGTPQTPSDHTRQEAEPWSQTLSWRSLC